jgi:arginase
VRVDLLSVPYDSGVRGARMGAGPEKLMECGLIDRLEQAGHEVVACTIRLPSDAFMPEVQAAFELDRRLAGCVAETIAAGAFPVILSGNCITSVGTVAGIGDPELGVIWLDAHGDFNTPETTLGGFLDGMALATLTGRCWTLLAATVPGFVPVAEKRVMLFGARDLDSREATALIESEIERLSPDAMRSGVHENLVQRGAHTQDVYLHIDLDSLDPSEGRANGFAVAGGFSVADVRSLVDEVASVFRIRAVAVTAFDPMHDTDGRVCEAGINLLAAAVDAVSRGRDSQLG